MHPRPRRLLVTQQAPPRRPWTREKLPPAPWSRPGPLPPGSPDPPPSGRRRSPSAGGPAGPRERFGNPKGRGSSSQPRHTTSGTPCPSDKPGPPPAPSPCSPASRKAKGREKSSDPAADVPPRRRATQSARRTRSDPNPTRNPRQSLHDDPSATGSQGPPYPSEVASYPPQDISLWPSKNLRRCHNRQNHKPHPKAIPSQAPARE